MNIFKTSDHIAMKSGDVHGLQMMNHDVFGDTLICCTTIINYVDEIRL